MTPQQDRRASAERHEFWALVYLKTLKLLKKGHGYVEGGHARRLGNYHKRMARNNRRAYRRNSV